MRAFRVLAVSVACAFGLAACGGGGATDSSSASGAPVSPVASAVPAVSITVQPDTAATVEQKIGADGGSITAKAADGTTFALTVPMGALPSDTVVTATPATLEGIDFPTYTVLFGPTGTQFTDWATLVITPSNDVPVDKQFMYQLTDDGSSFGAAFVDPKAEAPTILLDHFSGYGLAEATSPEVAAMLSKGADQAEARIQSELATILGQERQNQLLGSEGQGSAVSEALAKYMEQYEKEVVAPRVAASGSSCAALQEAMRTVLGLERQKQLLGFSESTGGMDFLNDVLSKNGGPCEKEAIEKCKAAKDPGILLSFWLGLERQRQLLGSEGAGFDLPALIKKARAICAPKAYEASGTLPSAPAGIEISGLICSLAEPFSLKMDGDLIGRMKFTPSSDQAGSLTYKARVSNAPFKSDGTGDYTVAYDDTQALATKIDVDVRGVIHIPVVGDTQGGGPGTITLTPTEPCAEQQ